MIGERIGNFNVVSQLGRGGMGEVYLGEHGTIGTRVAVKVLQPHISSNKDHVERFFNEAIAVSKIQHSGIGKIFDVGFHADRAYLVMEFLPGETLATRIRRLGKLPLVHVCELGRQICGVLEAVHKAGITHRDLKPDNIFIVPDEELPGGERVKILDFGIAKLSGAGPGLTATGSGSMGTPAYMSPEQWRNSKTVDWRADAYSLGCLTFEMIAGRPPFIAETIGEACSLHLTIDPPRLGSLVAVPAPLDALIASLLAKAPEQRPQTMREIANAFAALGQGIGLGAAPAMALGATMPSTPPQVAPNMATQATGIGHASAPPIGHAPTIKDPTPPPPISNTTLGGAAGSTEKVPAKPSDKRGLIWGLGGAVAALIVVVIVLALRGQSTQAGSSAKTEEARAHVDIADDIPARAGSQAGSGSAVGSASGSGSSAIAETITHATKDAAHAVKTAFARPEVGSGSGTGGRNVRRVEGVEGPKVGSGSGSSVARNVTVDRPAPPSSPPVVEPIAPNAPNEPVPNVRTQTQSILKSLYPRLNKCGKEHAANEVLVKYNLTTKPDGTFSGVTFVAQTHDFKKFDVSAAFQKCLTAVFESVNFGRATSVSNGFIVR